MAETLENTVQEHRKKAELTQQELADKVDVSRQTIIAIEKGGYVPSLMLAFKIANVFNTTVEQLFTPKKN